MTKISNTKHVTKTGQVKKNPTKEPTVLLKRMLYFEDLSTDYIDSQIKGIVKETSDSMVHGSYLMEKRNNITRFVDGALENFIARMKYPDMHKKFEKQKLPAYTKNTTTMLKKMLWFEWLATDYIDSQINGIVVETQKHGFSWFDDDYLNEKRENIVRFLRQATENFTARMQNPKIRAMWDEGKR